MMNFGAVEVGWVGLRTQLPAIALVSILSWCWATGRGRFQPTSAQSGAALKALGMGDGSNNGGH